VRLKSEKDGKLCDWKMIKMAGIVLTADRALFTHYHGNDFFGFGLCMPYRLIPKILEYRLLAPKIPVDGLRAKYAPYALGKVEASLLASGFSRENVVVTPPHMVGKAIDRDTEIVGVHVLDPKGLAPVSWTLKALSGGGMTCTELEFEKLIYEVKSLKEKYKFKVIVGGPGSWQLRGYEDKYGIDVLYEGECEITFPLIVKKMLDGEEVPRYVQGESAPVDKIPLITTPSRNGLVQITIGCPRRCRFCNPTTWKFRSIPLVNIMKEVEFNLKNGIKNISFVTEDVLLYGANGLQLNANAVKKLFKSTVSLAKKYGVSRKVGFSHVSCASALVMKDTVKYISEIEELSEDEPTFPQIGLESASPRIVNKYFRGKVYPWKPEDWPDILIETSKLFNDSYWYPCYTYIIGFPEATPDDYIATIELIDELKSEGFIGWTFPLLLIPMGGSMIERKKEVGFAYLSNLPEEAIDCMVAGWKLSVYNSRRLVSKLMKGGNPLISKIMLRLAFRAIDAMEEWINGIGNGVEVINDVYSKVNIRSNWGLLRTILWHR